MPTSLSYSSKGPRQTNQDYILSTVLDDEHSIFIVADGIGGFEHGEIASEISATSILDFFSGKPQLQPLQDTLHKLSIQICLKLMAKASGLKCKRMGSTAAAGYLFGNEAVFFWMGDSRIYHYRDVQLLFQSTDHSYINEMRANGTAITPFIHAQYSHIITRFLSNEKAMLFDFSQTTLQPGDHIIICSDGVYNIVPEVMLTSMVNTQPLSLQPLIDHCVQHATDNFSIILVRI
jgi:serine/threonine protein phosphatase PrpC